MDESTSDKILELLGDLADHILSATAERHSDETFCDGCHTVLANAVDWLDINDPEWQLRRAVKN